VIPRPPWARQLRLAANISMLYGNLPLHERGRAAAADGYRYVESWWPFVQPVPQRDELDSFCQSIDDAGVQLVSINLNAGDPARGERGMLSHPDSSKQVAHNLECALDVLDRTGCRIVNAVFGNRVDGLNWSTQAHTGLSRLIGVADAVSSVGATVVLETLNSTDSPRFPLTKLSDSAELVRQANERSESGNLRLLLDTYHLAVEGVDPAEAVRAHADLVHHVQYADFPGRGNPGTGTLDFAEISAALSEISYRGFVGLEYVPSSQIL
jgi:hydroxypyruvate isomerase